MKNRIQAIYDAVMKIVAILWLVPKTFWVQLWGALKDLWTAITGKS